MKSPTQNKTKICCSIGMREVCDCFEAGKKQALVTCSNDITKWNYTPFTTTEERVNAMYFILKKWNEELSKIQEGKK